jgi:hypothetical protein
LRLHTLQWLVGLSMAWTTMLIGAAVGVVLKYREGGADGEDGLL